jgi:hypothetical protein
MRQYASCTCRAFSVFWFLVVDRGPQPHRQRQQVMAIIVSVPVPVPGRDEESKKQQKAGKQKAS